MKWRAPLGRIWHRRWHRGAVERIIGDGAAETSSCWQRIGVARRLGAMASQMALISTLASSEMAAFADQRASALAHQLRHRRQHSRRDDKMSRMGSQPVVSARQLTHGPKAWWACHLMLCRRASAAG